MDNHPGAGKLKIMLVDDNQELARELHEALEDKGYDVIAVIDTGRVLDTARVIHPDIMLLDLKMPGKSGFQLMAELREDPDLEDIPVVVMSGQYATGDVGIMEVHGVKFFLKKPFSLEALTRALEGALAEKKIKVK